MSDDPLKEIVTVWVFNHARPEPIREIRGFSFLCPGAHVEALNYRIDRAVREAERQVALLRTSIQKWQSYVIPEDEPQKERI